MFPFVHTNKLCNSGNYDATPWNSSCPLQTCRTIPQKSPFIKGWTRKFLKGQLEKQVLGHTACWAGSKGTLKISKKKPNSSWVGRFWTNFWGVNPKALKKGIFGFFGIIPVHRNTRDNTLLFHHIRFPAPNMPLVSSKMVGAVRKCFHRLLAHLSKRTSFFLFKSLKQQWWGGPVHALCLLSPSSSTSRVL